MDELITWPRTSCMLFFRVTFQSVRCYCQPSSGDGGTSASVLATGIKINPVKWADKDA